LLQEAVAGMKHHYVPKFYLRSFVDVSTPAGYKPYLWVVDLDNRKVRRRSPENAAALTDYYAVGAGDERYEVEEYLGAVESMASPALARLLGDVEAVEPQDQAVLSYFAAVQLVRVPQFRDRLEAFITDIGQTLSQMLLHSRDAYAQALRESHPGRVFSEDEVDSYYEAARRAGGYRVKANPSASLRHGLNVVPKIAELLNRMSWAIMEPAGADNFWTSDNPVYYINPDSDHPLYGHGLGARGIEVNFPLGPRRCILMAWSEISAPRSIINDIRPAQERGIAGAKRYLYCSTEEDGHQALSVHRRLFPNRHRTQSAS
jgi:hypothetical protein